MFYQSSPDMIGMVHEISRRLSSVVPTYQRRVTQNLPQPVEARNWLKTYLVVYARFRKGDFRHTSKEFGDIAELAQWLVNLHAATNGTTPTQLTIREELMIVRERVLG